MRWQNEELVRVQSESELRPGMTVVLNPCRICRRQHAVVCLSPLPHGVCDTPGCRATRVWRSAGECHSGPGFVPGLKCRWLAVAEGRLYRLRDLDDSQETTKQRERERVE